MALFVRGKINLVKKKGEEYLLIQDCFIAPSRFSYIDYGIDLKDSIKVPFGTNVKLTVKPSIHLKLLRS
jgi:hypothetical protein